MSALCLLHIPSHLVKTFAAKPADREELVFGVAGGRGLGTVPCIWAKWGPFWIPIGLPWSWVIATVVEDLPPQVERNDISFGLFIKSKYTALKVFWKCVVWCKVGACEHYQLSWYSFVFAISQCTVFSIYGTASLLDSQNNVILHILCSLFHVAVASYCLYFSWSDNIVVMTARVIQDLSNTNLSRTVCLSTQGISLPKNCLSP